MRELLPAIIRVKYAEPSPHPVTKGLTDWTTVNEELYNNATGKLLGTASPLAGGEQDTKDKSGKAATAAGVVAWTNTYAGKARVFATTLGHNSEAVADAKYLDLVARGLLWSAGKLDEAHLVPARRVMLAD